MPSTLSITRWLSRRKLSLAQGCHFVVRSNQTGGGSLNRASSFHFGVLIIPYHTTSILPIVLQLPGLSRQRQSTRDEEYIDMQYAILGGGALGLGATYRLTQA